MRGSFATVSLGMKSLLLHKLRSSLTTLGILIGVASVVAMLAIGEGASEAAQEQIKQLGSTNILIQSVKPPQDETSSQMSAYTARAYGLTYNDATKIAGTLSEHIDLIVSVRQTDKQVRTRTEWQQSVLLGTSPAYLDVMGMEIATGRWLNETDLLDTNNICVLGAAVKERLFPLQDPLGRPIRASGDRFVVTGVLEKLGRRSGSVGRSVDDCIFIPISTSRARFGETNIKRGGGTFEMESVQLHEIKVKIKEESEVRRAAGVIDGMLKRAHKDGDYAMVVPLELLRQAKESRERFTLLLFFIASISLIVGGIGIMNVMLATVTERTREIGIRRALGARKKHIVSQFLVETVLLSGSGGLLGLATGIVASFLATSVWGADVAWRPSHWVLAFTISAVVGILAGLYPAWRAANMDPVEALRHE
ncbi:MAG: ABC transporter permease [Planctomycetota bacterium]|nr:ABC transporter permease [Planctomycetota bacterium]